MRRIKTVNLSSLVKGRTIILPQLAAPGVAAHTVTVQTGFKVLYGPVRAVDLPRFLANGFKADRQMRNVTFPFNDRLAVVPVELVQSWKAAAASFMYLIIVGLISGNVLSWSTIFQFLPYLGVILVGCALVPAFLPFVPGRSFAFKGWLVGIIAVLIFNRLSGQDNIINTANILILPALSAYLSLNFTGCTTYTSLSGVKKEMKIALPLLIFSVLSGMALHIYGVWRAL
jgi:hypothetical protein